MKIITVANRKGGAGKSTCAAHLAIKAVQNGMKVILIDMDPQKTLEQWWNRRVEENPYLFEADAKDLEKVMSKLNANGFDLCLIDTPGDNSPNSINSIQVADLVLIPTKPTPPDLMAIGRTISVVEDNKKDFLFIFTQSISRTKLIEQAMSVLSKFGQIAPSVISHRVCYANAMGQGGAAMEFDKHADEEISLIWDCIYERLFEPKLVLKRKTII